VWDIASLATLVRSVIDSYYVFFYLTIDECSEDEVDFRYFLWNYHAEKQRIDMLKRMKSENPIIDQILKNIENLKSNLLSNKFYNSLGTDTKKKIRKGKIGILLTNTELSKRAGIDPDYYKSTFNYLSAYVHGFPFASTQLAAFRAGSEESLELIKVIIDYCTGYISVAIRDFIKLLPEQSDKIDKKTKFLVEMWEYIFKNISNKRLDIA
jgi:Family of unknown function (DUF5677)